jgi:hypothetical protein
MANKIDSTLKERESRYGSFEHNAKITQQLCNVLKQAPNYDLLEEQHIEAFHMIFHKIARCVCGDPNYIDNIHDIVGYAKLLEEFLKDKKIAINLSNIGTLGKPKECFYNKIESSVINEVKKGKSLEEIKEEFEYICGIRK